MIRSALLVPSLRRVKVDEVAKAKVLRLADDAVKVLRNHEANLAFLIDEISEMAGEVDKIGLAA